MRRLLCFVVGLWVVVSGCKKTILDQAAVDAAYQRGLAAGSTSGGGGGNNANTNTNNNTNTNTVTTKTRDQIIEVCMPQIIAALSAAYPDDSQLFFRSRNGERWDVNTPTTLVYEDNTTWHWSQYYAWGDNARNTERNTATLSTHPDIRERFVARDDNAPGYKVYISTKNDGIDANAGGYAPGAAVLTPLPAGLTVINLPAAGTPADAQQQGGVAGGIPARINRVPAPDDPAAWYECTVDTATQDVTLIIERTDA